MRKQKKHSKVFIIEHKEKKLWPWCIIEYQHISKIVGKKNLIFTNIKDENNRKKLSKFSLPVKKSVKDLNLDNACVLDPESTSLLTPKKAKKYKYFIFGGILGDNPAKKRTKDEITKPLSSLPSFNISKAQMSTDNAVYVVKKITEGGNLSDIKFMDNIEIKINKIESTILPYRYVLVKGIPLISKELIRYLKDDK